jgi:2-isopropylmalate synthase
MEMVRIFDTTLRDGEQAPGFSMNTAEKLRLARRLEALGVDVIEAGFPIASKGDFEAVREVAREIKHSTVAGLARTRREDIDAALGALERAALPRVHVFLATSDLHLKHKLRISRTQALESIGKMVEYAKARCPEVEFSAEDASRSDIEFLGQAFSIAVDSGATILNAPDTVGYATPEEYGGMFRSLRAKVIDRPRVIWSAHCHNDLGLAVANSLAAVEAGARQVECTINGIGERAGNAAMEEIAVALAVRPDRYKTGTRLRLNELYATSRLLSEITGVSVPPNKAVVGANAFAHEAGIHQDGILKNPLTYQVISPEAVGVPAHKLVLGKHSGRNALRARLAELGVIISEDELRECYRQVMALADAKKEITDEDIKRAARRQPAEEAADEGDANVSDVAV